MIKKIDSLISLIDSLSKSEKRHISIALIRGKENTDYIKLYGIITKNINYSSDIIKSIFEKANSKTSFDIAVHYLYDRILSTILVLQKDSDKYYDIFEEINKARLLYSKSMFHECFESLSKAEEVARLHQNNEALLIIIKLELEYSLHLNFLNKTEKDLNHKHSIQNETLKKIRKITGQASLYHFLKLRLAHRGNFRTNQQRKAMDDLMISELYLVASSGMEYDFEIMKNHKLFQANYLISVGDYDAALNSYEELNLLFEENPGLWLNPPVYYLTVLEGILDNLRLMREYDEFEKFIIKMENLKAKAPLEFQVNVSCLQFQYRLFPYLDNGLFQESYRIARDAENAIGNKLSMLNMIRRSEYEIYIAISYFGIKEYQKAKVLLSNIITSRNKEYLYLTRTIRLIRLIVCYHLGEFETIEYEIASIKRSLSLKKEQSYRTEHTILNFLSNCYIPILRKEREQMWASLIPTINSIHNDRYEQQLLKIFDFTAWLKATILKEELSTVLHSRSHITAEMF